MYQNNIKQVDMKNKKAYKLYLAGEYSKAESLLKNPHSDFDINLLGLIYYSTYRYEQALTLFQKAYKLNQSNLSYLNNIGAVYKDTYNYTDAIKTFLEIIKLAPSIPEAYYNISSIYQLMGKLFQAEEYIQRALEINPDFEVGKNNLACIYIDQGKTSQAVEIFRSIIEKNPYEFSIFSNMIFGLNYLEELNNKTNQQIFLESLRYSQCVNEYISKNKTNKIMKETKKNQYKLKSKNNTQITETTQTKHTAQTAQTAQTEQTAQTTQTTQNIKRNNKSDKINIGYVSPDFKLHSVSYFAYPLIKFADTNKFNIFCYGNNQSNDQVTDLYKQMSNFKHVNNIPNDKLSDIIKKDKIDILVDLSGHSASNRLPVFAYQPAPVQVSYIGYPNTTGMNQIKYRFTDNFVDPILNLPDQFYTEELIRLDNIFLTYYPGYKTLKTIQIPRIDNGYTTYGSFNNRAKINDYTIDLWSDLLKQDDSAKLILKSSIASDEGTLSELHKKFFDRDIDHRRIKIYPFMDFNNHLSLYQKIDVALDTYPYNGTTTTCEALWSGVPVVTLMGETHRSRVSADILTCVGLNKYDCIADTRQDYIDKAITLSRNIRLLAVWKEKHKDIIEGSHLMNYNALLGQIEAYYTKWSNEI